MVFGILCSPGSGGSVLAKALMDTDGQRVGFDNLLRGQETFSKGADDTGRGFTCIQHV
jgi:hypothetical protein